MIIKYQYGILNKNIKLFIKLNRGGGLALKIRILNIRLMWQHWAYY